MMAGKRGASQNFQDGRRGQNKRRGIKLHASKQDMFSLIAALEDTEETAVPPDPNWPPKPRTNFGYKKDEPMDIHDETSLMDAADRNAELQAAVIHDQLKQENNLMTSYNPDEPLNAYIPEAQTAYQDLEEAKAEYAAIKDEMDRIYKDRLEIARDKMKEAETKLNTVKADMSTTAMEQWLINPTERKFWTVDKLITVKEFREIEKTYDRDAVRRWCFENMPAALEVNWTALERLAEDQDKIGQQKYGAKYLLPMPPIKVVPVNRVEFNIEKVAKLGEIDAAALVEKAMNGVNTKLMVQKDGSDAD